MRLASIWARHGSPGVLAERDNAVLLGLEGKHLALQRDFPGDEYTVVAGREGKGIDVISGGASREIEKESTGREGRRETVQSRRLDTAANARRCWRGSQTPVVLRRAPQCRARQPTRLPASRRWLPGAEPERNCRHRPGSRPVHVPLANQQTCCEGGLQLLVTTGASRKCCEGRDAPRRPWFPWP